MKIKKDIILRRIGSEYIIIVPNKNTVDLTEVYTLNETSAWIWEQFKDKEFTIEHIVDVVEQYYEVDRDKAMSDVQVFVNILLNALEGSPTDSPVTMIFDTALKRVSIMNEVIPDMKVDAEKLFEPFYTTKAHGSGLGMAISRKIMEIHGFYIFIEQISPFTVVLDFNDNRNEQ